MEIAHWQNHDDFCAELVMTPAGQARTELLSRLATQDRSALLVSQLLRKSWREFWLGMQAIFEILALPDDLLDMETQESYGSLLGCTPALPTTDEIRAEFTESEHDADQRRALLTRLLTWDKEGATVEQLIDEWGHAPQREWLNAQVIVTIAAVCEQGVNPRAWTRCHSFLRRQLADNPTDLLAALPAELFAMVQGYLDIPDQKRLTATSRGLHERVELRAQDSAERTKYQKFVAQLGGEKQALKRKAPELDIDGADLYLRSATRASIEPELNAWKEQLEDARRQAKDLRQRAKNPRQKQAAKYVEGFLIGDLMRHSFHDDHVDGTQEATAAALHARWERLMDNLTRKFESDPGSSRALQDIRDTVGKALVRLPGLHREYAAALRANAAQIAEEFGDK